ncbi:MAG: hypothetical protein LBI80_01535 [Endomicrobium sp.]|jgi:hypothetical protein|nr:hypothetical protein [Endomicrobium sp.]
MRCSVECKLKLSVLFKKILNFILSSNQWCYKLNSIKTISIILINSILLTFVYGQSIAQVTQNIKSAEQFKQIFTDFTLPYSYGKITAANYARSDTVIINIQDLHLHAEVQKNIENIISTFDKEFGLKNVYLEGAYGQVDTSWIANIKDKDKKEKTINSIFATGALTGAEYYSAMSNKPTIIKGLESQEPYLNNLKRFGDILYAQDEIVRIFNSMEGNVKYLKSLYFNRKQNKIEELSKKYMSGDLDAKKYFVLLNKYADSLGVDLNKYENINLYIELLNLGRQIDYDRSTKELQLLILKLKELLPYGAYKMMLDSTSDFSDIDRVYTYLVRLSRKNNIDLSINFPELNKFFSYIELSEKINPMDMLKEEQRLKDELNIAFSYDDGEKEIAFLSGFMTYLKDYLSSKITSDDYNYYEKNIKKFKRLWIKYIDNQKLKSLSKYENTAEKFYKINLDRNNYFMENIDVIKDVGKISKEFPQDLSETDKVIQSLKEAKNVSVVITGGFHTQGVSDMLKEQGISYIVITPNVSGGLKLAEDVYYALAKEQSKILFQALATLNLTQVPESMKPLMLADVLTQKGYTVTAINEALKDIVAQGQTAQLTGSLDNLESIELTVSRNGQTTTYNYDGEEFKVKTSVSQTQEERQSQGSQKSRSSIWFAVKGFVTVSLVSAAIIAGSSVAIGLTVVSGFLWFLAPLIFFGLLFIGNMSFMGYELYQDSFLAKEDSSPSDIEEGMTDVYMFKKLLQSLPQGLAKEFASAALRVPLESVDGLLYGYASDLAQRIEELSLTEAGAVMETGHAGIKLNYSMIRAKFFDGSGKNIINQRMLEVFVKHELRHESFRTSTGFFGKFVHSNPWLEEFIVSAGDLFSTIGSFFGSLFRSVQKPLTEINLNSYSNIEQSLTILLGRDSREISQKLQTFCMLNPNINLTEDVFKSLGFSEQDAKILVSVKFNLTVNTQNLNFEDILSSNQSLDLVKQLISIGNPDAIVLARAIELLGYNSIDTFEEFKNIAKSTTGNTSAEKFKTLKETLIQKVNNNVVTQIKNDQPLSEAFSIGFLTPQLISLQNMLSSQDISENDIKDVAKSQAASSFQGLFESLVRQKLTEKLYTSIENMLPQEFKTQETKDVLFNSIVGNLSSDLGNLTEALANAKESLLKQVIHKNQNELDLLSVSLAKQKGDATETAKNNLAVLDKDVSDALREYSFGVVDQSQYNQQTAEFVNTVKDVFVGENSWQQLKNRDTRDKLVNFLKQYYDPTIVESNISFFESITSKNETLTAISSLLVTLINNRRVYNDVNLQRALVDLFPFSMQYADNEILNGESLILQSSIDQQEVLVSNIKTYMLILADLNSFSTQDTSEKQRVQSLIVNYGKYALSVLDYPINNGSVAFKIGSRLRDIRTSLFNTLKDMGVDVSNIEYPQDRLFAQQQPELTQDEQKSLFAQLPREIENLEKQTRENKKDKQLLKNLNNSQGKLDDAIFAGQNVSASARRMVSTIRNIMQTVIDKGDFDLDELEQLKDLAQQCRPMVLASNSDRNLNLDMYNAAVIGPLDILIQKKSVKALDVKDGLSLVSFAIDGLLRLQANFKATTFESFLRNENDRTINFALKEGDISNLYVALTFSRLNTVLNDMCAVYQTLTTDLETSVSSRMETGIILERLRYWLPSGSAAKEFARLDLVNVVGDTVAKFQEVLRVGQGYSARITLENINSLQSVQLAKSDYQQTVLPEREESVKEETSQEIQQPQVVQEQETTQKIKSEEAVVQQTQELSQTQPREEKPKEEPQATTQEEQTSTEETEEGIKSQEEEKEAVIVEAKPIEDQDEKVRLLGRLDVANIDFAKMLGVTGSDDEVKKILEDAKKTSFVSDVPKTSEIFKEGISREELIKNLLGTNYEDAVNIALALKNLNLTDQEFQDILSKSKERTSSDSDIFENLKYSLIEKVESGLMDKIREGKDIEEVLKFPFPSYDILRLKNMLRLEIVRKQDVKNLAKSSEFKVESFFDELKKIIATKVIDSRQKEVSKVLSQEDINTANNFIQRSVKYLALNENPNNVAMAMYGIMILSDLYDNYESKKDLLTEENLRNTLNSYFPNLIAKERMDSFFESGIELQESIKRATDYLLSNTNYFGYIKVDLLQNRISLNQKQILSTSDKTKLSERKVILERYEKMLKDRYKEVTKKTADTLNEVLIKQPFDKLEFKLSMIAVDIMIARNDIAKIIDTKDDYDSLKAKLQRDEDLLRYLTNLSEESESLFLSSEEQVDEINKKIRILCNDSTAIHVQLIVSATEKSEQFKDEQAVFAATKGKSHIQEFIASLSIDKSLSIDTELVYDAITDFLKAPRTKDTKQSLISVLEAEISTPNKVKFKEISDNFISDSSKFFPMLSFIANDIIQNAKGDVSKLKKAVFLNGVFNNMSIQMNAYNDYIYSLAESLNALTKAMDQTDPQRLEFEKKLQELLVMGISVAGIDSGIVQPESAAEHLDILEKEEKILQGLRSRVALDETVVVRIIRQREMLIKNFVITPLSKLDNLQESSKLKTYRGLLLAYNKVIIAMSDQKLLSDLSDILPEEYYRTLSDDELLKIVQGKDKGSYDRLTALSQLRSREVSVSDGFISDLQGRGVEVGKEDKAEDIKTTVSKIVTRLNVYGQITSEEMSYLESIKGSQFYPGKDLVNAIKLNLQLDVQMPIDFASKVLQESDFERLINEIANEKERLTKNHPKFDEPDDINFKYAVSIVDKALASLSTEQELKSNLLEYGYFYVTKFSKNKDKLIAFLRDKNNNIRYRLYAYGYLKAMGVNTLDEHVQSSEFLAEVRNMLESKRLKVGSNYFDLRACEIGINIVASAEVFSRASTTIDAVKLAEYNSFNKKTYETIMESNFVGLLAGRYENARSGLSFTFAKGNDEGLDMHERMYRRIAHELGHRQLYALGIYGTEAKSSSMFHEFFADIVAGSFMSKFLGRKIEQIIADRSSMQQPYKVFSKERLAESAADEGHDAARGLINSIKKAFDLAGKVMNYEAILALSIQISQEVQGEGLFKEQQEENLAKKIVTAVALATADVTVKEEDKGEFLYQFVKGEKVKFENFQEEKEVFGVDAKGQKALFYYLVAKHEKFLTKGTFFLNSLEKEEKKFIENYRKDDIVPITSASSMPVVQPIMPPVLAPSFDNPLTAKQVPSVSETASSRHSVLWYIGISIVTVGIYWGYRYYISYKQRLKEMLEDVIKEGSTEKIDKKFDFIDMANFREQLLGQLKEDTMNTDVAYKQYYGHKEQLARVDTFVAKHSTDQEIRSKYRGNAKYFSVIRASSNISELIQIVQNKSEGIQYRLYAYGYLKAMNINSLDDYVKTQGFFDGVKDILKAKTLDVTTNYFDLRAAVIAINLIASTQVMQELDYYAKDKMKNAEKETYQMALGANFVSGDSFNANSNLDFIANLKGLEDFGKNSSEALYTVIAHELGHRYLFSLGFNTGTKAKAMFHEQFADTVAGVFNVSLFGKDISSESFIASQKKTFKAFASDTKREEAAQEEHYAARWLMRSIKAAIGAVGKHFNFSAMLKASVLLAMTAITTLQGPKLFDFGQQAAVAREVIFGVSNAMEQIDSTFDKGEFIYKFIEQEGVNFNSLKQIQAVFGTNPIGKDALYNYLIALHKKTDCLIHDTFFAQAKQVLTKQEIDRLAGYLTQERADIINTDAEFGSEVVRKRIFAKDKAIAVLASDEFMQKNFQQEKEYFQALKDKESKNEEALLSYIQDENLGIHNYAKAISLALRIEDGQGTSTEDLAFLKANYPSKALVGVVKISIDKFLKSQINNRKFSKILEQVGKVLNERDLQQVGQYFKEGFDGAEKFKYMNILSPTLAQQEGKSSFEGIMTEVDQKEKDSQGTFVAKLDSQMPAFSGVEASAVTGSAVDTTTRKTLKSYFSISQKLKKGVSFGMSVGLTGGIVYLALSATGIGGIIAFSIIALIGLVFSVRSLIDFVKSFRDIKTVERPVVEVERDYVDDIENMIKSTLGSSYDTKKLANQIQEFQASNTDVALSKDVLKLFGIDEIAAENLSQSLAKYKFPLNANAPSLTITNLHNSNYPDVVFARQAAGVLGISIPKLNRMINDTVASNTVTDPLNANYSSFKKQWQDLRYKLENEMAIKVLEGLRKGESVDTLIRNNLALNELLVLKTLNVSTQEMQTALQQYNPQDLTDLITGIVQMKYKYQKETSRAIATSLKSYPTDLNFALAQGTYLKPETGLFGLMIDKDKLASRRTEYAKQLSLFLAKEGISDQQRHEALSQLVKVYIEIIKNEEKKYSVSEIQNANTNLARTMSQYLQSITVKNITQVQQHYSVLENFAKNPTALNFRDLTSLENSLIALEDALSKEIKESEQKEIVREIAVKLRDKSQISKEEITYLESLKNSAAYQGDALVEAIKIDLELGKAISLDFASKVLREDQLNQLADYFTKLRKDLLENYAPAFSTDQEKIYRDRLTVLDNAIAAILSEEKLRQKFPTDYQYFIVTKYSKNQAKLTQILKDNRSELKARLYAYGYLKVMGINDQDDYTQSEQMLSAIKDMLKDRKLQIGSNYFDLRACELAINIVISKEVLTKASKNVNMAQYNEENKDTYGLIMSSIFAQEGLIANAHSGLVFEKRSWFNKFIDKVTGVDEYEDIYQIIAHELGHDQLRALGVDGESSSVSMFHEFFADTVAGLFISKSLKQSVNKLFSSIMYLWFTAIKAFKVFSRSEQKEQSEEHASARGLMNSIRSAFQQTGRIVGFDVIMEVSIKIASTAEREGLFQVGKQSELSRRIVEAVASAVAEKDNTFSRGDFLYRFMQEEDVSFESLEDAKAVFADKDGNLTQQGQKDLAIYLMAKHDNLWFFRKWGSLYQEEKSYLESYLSTHEGLVNEYQNGKNSVMEAKVVPTTVSVATTAFYAIGIIVTVIVLVGLIAFGMAPLVAIAILCKVVMAMGITAFVINIGKTIYFSKFLSGYSGWAIAGALVAVIAGVLSFTVIFGAIASIAIWVVVGAVALASIIGLIIAAYRWYKSSRAESKRTEMEDLQASGGVPPSGIAAPAPVPVPTMQESVASARFTSIRAGILAFFNTGGFVTLVVLLSLSVITGVGAIVAAAIVASILAIIGVMSILSSIYESNQKKVIKDLEKSGAPLPEQESRHVFANLVRSLPQETAVKFVQAVFNNVNLANGYLNLVSSANGQDDIETNADIINALNNAMVNNNSVVMETTDTGKILFSPYIVSTLLNNPIMLRVVVEHELHHLEYANAKGGLLGFIHRFLPGLEEFIVSFRNVFRWFGAKLQDRWRTLRGNVPVVWNLPEGLALGDVLINKVNEQGFIEAPNIQTGHVQLANGRRGTLSYRVTRNGLEVPNFEFGKTRFLAKDIGDVEITYTFTPDVYTLSFATNDADATPTQIEIKDGEALEVDAVKALPQRKGYEFSGYKYVNAQGLVRTITNQEVLEGFDIPASDITGDLKLQALWTPERSDIVFVDENGTAISTVSGAAITGQNVRVQGLGRGRGVLRGLGALVGIRTGVETTKIAWKFDEGIAAPERLPVEIDVNAALQAPLIAEGKVKLKDGRFGTVQRVVKIDGKEVDNFQYGLTPVTGALSVEYTFTPEQYNINFVANGADSNTQVSIKNAVSDDKAYHVEGVSTKQLPTKAGHLFKGYSYTNKDGVTLDVSRLDVVNGFDIDAKGVAGDINLVARWVKIEEAKEEYEVEFANASAASKIIDNATVKTAVFGEPYTIDHNLIAKNITSLETENWKVKGYVVSVNGVDIMNVKLDNKDNISDITLPVQEVVGKISVRFLRNPKVTFVDKFAKTSKQVAVETDSSYTKEDLGKKVDASFLQTMGKDTHWSRSDGKRLTAPITEPVTFTYSTEFHDITDYETKGAKPSVNILVFIGKGIVSITKGIYNIITTSAPVSIKTVIKTAIKSLTWKEGIRLVFCGLVIFSLIPLLGMVVASGLLSGFLVLVLVVAVAIIAVTLVLPIVEGYFTAAKEKAEAMQKEADQAQATAETEQEKADLVQKKTEAAQEIEKFNYYLEVLNFVKDLVNPKAGTSKAVSVAKVITYIVMTAIVVLGFLSFAFGVVLTSVWFVVAASVVLAIVVLAATIFCIVKYNTSVAFKTFVKVILDLFKSGNLGFKASVVGGLLLSIGAFVAFFVAPIAFIFSLLLLLGSLISLFATVAWFFSSNYNMDRIDQSIRKNLIGIFADKDNPHLERITMLLGAIEEAKKGTTAKNSLLLLLSVIGYKNIFKQIKQGVMNIKLGDILSMPKALYNAIFHPDPEVVKAMVLIGKGVAVFAKPKVMTIAKTIKDYSYGVAGKIKGVAVKYANNIYDAWTNIATSLDAVPTKEGFKFDGYEITSENLDIKTIITAEQANTDFAVPADMVNGKVTIKVRWKPNISINTGDGTRSRLGSSTKDSLEADATNGVVDLSKYEGRLTPPAGYDYGSLSWTSTLFPGKTFASNEKVNVDKPGSFTPNWKPLPQVRVSIGSGNWKDRIEGDTSTQREVQVVANTLGGADVNLKKLSKELQSPQDCDPNSLYWVTDDTDLSTHITNSIVTATQNTTYIPRWKRLCDVGKVKIQTGEGSVVNRAKDGSISLASISRDLNIKTPVGFKEGSLYWTSDIDPTKRFTGNINAEDAKNISVLTPHWIEDPLYQDNYNIFSEEEYTDMDAALSSHPVKFFSGVAEGEMDNVKCLPSSLASGFSQSDGGYTFPGFTNSWLGMRKYWTPERPGYKFVGVKVEAKNRKNEVLKSWSFEANPNGTMDAFNIDSFYALGPLEISMMWIPNEELEKQKTEEKGKQEEEKATQEELVAELKTEEERAGKAKELAEQKIIEQEQSEQARILAQQKTEQESVGKIIPLQADIGIMKLVKDGLTSKDFPIKFGQDFHFPGLVERSYLNQFGIFGSRKWMPKVDGFDFNGLKITIGGKTRIINRQETMNGFDIKKEDLEYKDIGSEGLIKISLLWQRKGTKQKSQETASETSIQATQIASVLAADMAKMTMPDKLVQLPLMAMSKLMTNISEFETYQTEQIKIAQESVNSLNYYMEIDDSSVLNKITNSLPFDIKEAFGQNVSIIENNAPGVVMSFDPSDGKIHVNYKMLRAMFFDEQGNIKNQDLLEVFVKHELRHKKYATEQNQFSKMVHSIDELEEFVVSMGDIYDWSKLHPEITNLQANYEEAIAFVMSDPALVAIAAKVGRQEAFNIAQTQSRLYYREIEDQVISLLVPTYAQEPTMFNNVDMKKSPRLIVVNSQIGAGSAELGQAQVFKDGGYSTALIERLPQGSSVESYRIPVSATFSASGQEMIYDVYVREVNSVHVIGLKLKENINKELDTAENYAKAVLTFTRDVNTNSVLRKEFNTLKGKASQMYGISSNLEINSKGISMMDFSGLSSNGETIDVNKKLEGTTQQQGQSLATEWLSQEDLKGVYIANDLEISQGTLQTIDQDIKAEEIFKLDEPEKFYQVSISAGKLESKFIERAVRVKMEQGATAIILDVAGDINIGNKQVTDRLLTALTAIHSLGLKAVMKVDMNKVYASKGEIFRKLFELGFDGINMDGQQETDVTKLKEVLDLLKVASEKYAIGARNAIQLKDEEVKEALKNNLGQTGFEGYNILVVTEINDTTGEMKVEASKMQKTLNKGYDRARKLGEMQIQVNASNLGAMSGLLTTKAEIITAGQIREAINQAGLNQEVVKHIDKLLKETTTQEQGTAKVLETLGFARGLVEASLVNRYMNAFDFTQETYQMNSVTDRQALGVVLTKAYLISSESFASKEALQQYFKEAENTMIEESQSATFEQQRVVMAGYVNSVVSQIELEGLIETKETEKMQIAISIAVLNDSINKISFNRIVEDAKRRTKTSTNAVKSILGAA